MQSLLDQAGLNMPVLRLSHDLDSDSPSTPSFEDRIWLLHAQAHAILAATSTFCQNAKGLDRDARLWGACNAVAAADYHGPIPPEVQSNPKSALIIDELNLSIRTVRGLKQGGLQTAGEIAAYTADELKVLCNLGNKSVRELAEELPALGISFSASE